MTPRTWPLVPHVLDDFTLPWRQRPAPVVLLHPGLGGNSRLFRSWVPVLADEFRVLRLDPRWLDKPAGYEWSLDSFVDDAVALMDEIEIESVHWVGASGGGLIGQHAALSVPDRIRSLSLVATTARFHGPVDQDYDSWLEPLDQGNHAAFLQRDAARRFGSDDPARAAWIINELARTPGRVSAELHRWVRGVDMLPALERIACPALVVTGEHDTLTDVSGAQLLADGIPDARLEILRGLPHNIAYTHPREVALLVREFILAGG